MITTSKFCKHLPMFKFYRVVRGILPCYRNLLFPLLPISAASILDFQYFSKNNSSLRLNLTFKSLILNCKGFSHTSSMEQMFSIVLTVAFQSHLLSGMDVVSLSAFFDEAAII